LAAIEQALHPTPVVRADFPYRLAGRRIPDRAPVLLRTIHETVLDACQRFDCKPEQLVIGGRSMGGRMCSMAIAGFDGTDRVPQPAATSLPVAGLVCIGYPLHPPRQPDKLRVTHLAHIAVPSLFVSGTRDEFATPDELRHHVAAIRGLVQIEFVEGARHDLRQYDEAVAAMVAAWVRDLN